MNIQLSLSSKFYILQKKILIINMQNQALEIKAALQIQKPVHEFFEAISNPDMGNTDGWANFLACLKAYLEYGINLRKGAFDFLKKQ